VTANTDQSDSDADGLGDLCVCDTCSPEQWCQTNPDGVQVCLDSCVDESQCGDMLCCPLGSACAEDGSTCLLSDIELDGEYMSRTMSLREENIREDDCVIEEGCVGGPGDRRLLRFGVRALNVGEGPLHLGRPNTNENVFEYSDCHGHYHFTEYAHYELLDSTGAVVVTGRKQAFCLMDLERVEDDAGRGRYHCSMQGISKGWADIYDSALDCQWIDVTGVPAGDYMLRVVINPEHILAELSYDNNSAEVPVTLTEPSTAR
jgi:hypothetical protein